jgi:hypothetical protein
MSNPKLDAWVDKVYEELEDLYSRDKNYKKYLLGNYPMKKIFDEYADWLAVNSTLSPRVAANTLYKDVIGVGYFDFARKKVKRGYQLLGIPSFNLIYGTQKEIDQANQILNQLKANDPKRYDLIKFALEKTKEVSDTVTPAKNIFGKTTNIAKQQTIKMPRLATLQSFMSMNDNQIRSYVAKFHKAAQPRTTPPAAYKPQPPTAPQPTTPTPQATTPNPQPIP